MVQSLHIITAVQHFIVLLIICIFGFVAYGHFEARSQPLPINYLKLACPDF